MEKVSERALYQAIKGICVTQNATLEAKTPGPDPEETLEAWSVSIAEIFDTADLRFDATHFDQAAARAVKALLESGVPVDPLSTVARVELRSQFTRIWAKDPQYGLPYLNATDLLSLFALGAPAGGQRYLSYATETDIDSFGCP